MTDDLEIIKDAFDEEIKKHKLFEGFSLEITIRLK